MIPRKFVAIFKLSQKNCVFLIWKRYINQIGVPRDPYPGDPPPCIIVHMTPAGAAHNSADLIKGIEKKWEDTKLFMNTLAKISMVKRRKAVTARIIISWASLPSLAWKAGPHVDASRVQTVVTKRESESFCVHKFIKLSLVINDNLC